MPSTDEYRLHLHDAATQFQKLGETDTPWSAWFASFMVDNGLTVDEDELAIVLREADTEYGRLPDQEAWINYMCQYLSDNIK